MSIEKGKIILNNENIKDVSGGEVLQQVQVNKDGTATVEFRVTKDTTGNVIETFSAMIPARLVNQENPMDDTLWRDLKSVRVARQKAFNLDQITNHPTGFRNHHERHRAHHHRGYVNQQL